MRVFTSMILFALLAQVAWANNGSSSRTGSQEKESLATNTENAKENLEHIKNIARLRGIVLDGWLNGTHIELSSTGNALIIQETTASTTKYLSITPVVSFGESSLTIDCSYVKSDNSVTVSVGTYCRGETESSADNVEDAVSDQHMLTYSTNAEWLSRANGITQCAHPMGLRYSDLYVVRCNSRDNDETTDGLSIFLLDKNYKKILSINGYEFAPNKSVSKPKHAEFWGIQKNLIYEILKKNLQ